LASDEGGGRKKGGDLMTGGTAIPVSKDADAILDLAVYLRNNRNTMFTAGDLCENANHIFSAKRKAERYSSLMIMVGLLRIAKAANLIKDSCTQHRKANGSRINKYYFHSTNGGKYANRPLSDYQGI
jgi:hypothetical protein